MTTRPVRSIPAGVPPGMRAGAWSPMHGARACYIIRSAINQRMHLVRLGVGSLTATHVDRPKRELEMWLATHLSPSKKAIVEFHEGRLWTFLRDLMPSTGGGGSLLEEFEALAQ